MDKITHEKLEKYFLISRDAFELAKRAECVNGKEGVFEGYYADIFMKAGRSLVSIK